MSDFLTPRPPERLETNVGFIELALVDAELGARMKSAYQCGVERAGMDAQSDPTALNEALAAYVESEYRLGMYIMTLLDQMHQFPEVVARDEPLFSAEEYADFQSQVGSPVIDK